MIGTSAPLSLLALALTLAAGAKDDLQKDVIPTRAGDLEITFIGHGSLLLKLGGKVVHVDPYGRLADYSQLPPADLILITHEHRDHLDLEALAKVRTPDTAVVLNEASAAQVKGGIVLKNGDTRAVKGLEIKAVPAYNLVHKRDNGQPFHPKGIGNGYVVTFGGKRVYVAGDTENTPEMKALRRIDVAFLPMNLPYTMTPEMVADAARAFRPRILYPYHYGETDPSALVRLLKDEKGIEVRIRRMQ